ncbi:YCF48-related protein [Flavitalea sp. BT771]|uniref:YCF48-related protein n=1 Tax=Flavitalea sp. BT771 TaxID=3063329 RepID=UPI0026E40C0B|nr:YCF48-related protein [Flavitalea sp. BT771]MDO6432339.1 YCF48-related protein [Flavitalea sp. BT771]MDV6221249.1 YCF48-related protein [Flavitalea sp. BT771]
MRTLFSLAIYLFITPLPSTHAQKIELLTSGTQSSFRGLSVVSDRIVWVSGSNGAVGRSVDGGSSWDWIIVPGYEKRDFRDIEAFDENTAIIMAIAEPASILKTTDGGKTWKQVYNNTTPGMFLDAMEFMDSRHGIVIGDPIKGNFFIVNTTDGGNSWSMRSSQRSIAADSGEACFASSGTNIRLVKGNRYFISGGLRSRLFKDGQGIDLPIIQGTASTGANSIAVQDKDNLIVVGGDFTHDTSREKNCVLTHDAGRTWIAPATPPHGYRSCVEYFDKDKLITCGTSGVDISTDGGLNWELIDPGSFHVCSRAKKGKTVFLAGGGGRVARLVL